MSEAKEKQQKNKGSDHPRIFWLVTASFLTDYLFIVLPFVVIFVVLKYSGRENHIYEVSEWAFASVILSGQAIIKFLSGVLKRPGAELTRVILICAFMLVFGMVLSVTILVLVLREEYSLGTGKALSDFLVYSQLGTFAFGSLLMYLMGGTGEFISREVDHLNENANG